MNHIVFHNDVDGIMSASLLRCYDADEYSESCLYPVTSTMRGGQTKKIWSGISAEDKVAILDFEYSGRADLWIDHHFNSDLGPHPVKNNRLFYDPGAKSAAALVMEKCEASLAQKEIIHMCNMIDSALYPNVNFIFESDHPLMILRAYLETAFPSDMTYCRIVEMISHNKCDIEKSLCLMRIGYDAVKNIQKLARQIGKNMVRFGSCSCVNQSRPGEYPRYSEFFVQKDVEYSIRISKSGPHQKYIQIGFNHFVNIPNTINLGEFLRGLPYVRGGGHFNVAAGIIKNEDEERFLDDIDMHFNQEADMEKYGVDKKDPVENRAQELVKEGVDIDAARVRSQKEMEKESDASSESELQSEGDFRKQID